MENHSDHSPEPDAEWKQSFHRGQPEAIDRLVDWFYSDALRYAEALLEDPESAEVAAQETFLRLLERHRLFSPRRPFRPWFFRICRNCCIDLIRARTRHAARIVSLDPDQGEIESLTTEMPRAFEEAIRGECERDIAAVLDSLTEVQRSVVLLHLLENLTFREIGAVLDRPQNTVVAIYYRTLKALRPRLAEWNQGNGARSGLHGT